MESEFLELAYIGFRKVIMHGRLADGRDKDGCNREVDIEQVLTLDQAGQAQDLMIKQRHEMRELLRGFVSNEDGQG